MEALFTNKLYKNIKGNWNKSSKNCTAWKVVLDFLEMLSVTNRLLCHSILNISLSADCYSLQDNSGPI